MPWYLDSSNLDEEELYYRAHADPTMSNWNRDQLPRWKLRRLASSSAAPADPPDAPVASGLPGEAGRHPPAENPASTTRVREETIEPDFEPVEDGVGESGEMTS